MDENLALIVVAPFYAMAYLALGFGLIVGYKAVAEMFAPADTHAIQDKVNPVLVPGTTSQQSTQGK